MTTKFLCALMFTVFTVFPVMAIQPDSAIGKAFIETGMSECISTATNTYKGADFGAVSEYCYCALTETTKRLSVEQISEYYKHGAEIDAAMNEAMSICMAKSKKLITKIFVEANMEDCMDSFWEFGLNVGFEFASEYCYCTLSETVENVSADHLTEYYKHGAEIEKAMNQATVKCLSKMLE